MRWPELDLRAGLWRMPSAEEYRPKRTKNGEEHIVDLSPQVITILQELPQCGELVFSTTGTTPPSGFSKVKRRIDAAMCLELNPKLWRSFCKHGGDNEDEEIADAAAKKLGFTDAKKLKASILRPWRTHDLRRTWATHVGEQLKFREAVVERALNHLTGTQSGLVGVYQRGEFREERREAQLAWGNFVERLVT
jgi:integrase